MFKTLGNKSPRDTLNPTAIQNRRLGFRGEGNMMQEPETLRRISVADLVCPFGRILGVESGNIPQFSANELKAFC